MNWIEYALPMLAGASLTLGLIQGAVWLRNRTQPAGLAFALAASAIAALMLMELATLRSSDPVVYQRVLWMAHVPMPVLFLSLIVYIHVLSGCGRRWLALLAIAVRLWTTAINFLGAAPNIHLTELRSLRQVEFLGNTVSVIGDATPNPWYLLTAVANLLLVAYVLDVLVTLRRRRASVGVQRVCWVILAFYAFAVGWGTLVTQGLVHGPFVSSGLWVIVVVVMAHALGSDLFRARQIAVRLEESELRAQEHERKLRERFEQAAALHRDELAHLSRVAMLGELSASLVHELNQPLAAILSNAQAAQRFMGRDQPDLAEVSSILDDIVANDRRAGQVIQRLRALFRKDRSQQREVDVKQIVLEVLQLIRNDLLNRGIGVEAELDDDLPVATGDAVQLQQVLLNLTMNACEAMEAGGVREPIRARARRKDARTIEVSISDCGPGVSEEQLGSIFLPFMTTKPQGMGLGLAVSRSIIEAHGGRLWVLSTPGQGATFGFDLPIAAAPAAR
ncbi:MAG TPA: ATP-binding protein [Xanthomonadales bacterium]|nr:ATP-binding protein [Xanthomonadales bacterium]